MNGHQWKLILKLKKETEAKYENEKKRNEGEKMRCEHM